MMHEPIQRVGLSELRALTSAASRVFNKLNSGGYATRGELTAILRGPINQAQAAINAADQKAEG